MFNQVSAWGTLTVAPLASPSTAPPRRIVAGWRSILWNHIYRPHFLGFSGLALAVALWGFGYKLSLYHPHPAPAQRTIVAKLWTEPPNASIVAAQRHRNQSNTLAGPQALCTSIQYSHLDRAPVSAFTSKGRGVQSSSFPAPLRSPPQNFRTA